MSAREPIDRHSDLGPSSKDWQTGSPGRDEDFTPDKDLWTLNRKGNIGEGRPGEDIHSGGVSGAAGTEQNAFRPGASGSYDKTARTETQPGTGQEGRSWQSRRPDPDSEDDKLDQALKDTFPTSDPPQPTQPGVTGWDVGNKGGIADAGFSERAPTRSAAAPQGVQTFTRRMAGVPWRAAALAVLPVLFAAVRMVRRSRRSPRR